jgi:hypothetical protein
MYSSLPHFVIGFHGCDKIVANEVVSQNLPHLLFSKNKWDWLGNGIYFWEQNYQRALEWADYLKDNPDMIPKSASVINTPAAIGAVIDLGKCLNLLDGKSIGLVKRIYELFEKVCKAAGTPLPQNSKKARNLDCAVINFVNLFMQEQGEKKYDTVRGMFYEGSPLYEDSGFLEQNHIQICVINPNCIKGYFHPMSPDIGYDIPS